MVFQTLEVDAIIDTLSLSDDGTFLQTGNTEVNGSSIIVGL